MQLNAVGVTSKDFSKTVEFYKLLGFEFPEYKADDDHLEPVTINGSARLMIDSVNMIKSIVGTEPTPSNHSAFAVQFDTVEELNQVVEKVRSAGFAVKKEPWDAYWGQRYAIVADPDGYKVDLYATL